MITYQKFITEANKFHRLRKKRLQSLERQIATRSTKKGRRKRLDRDIDTVINTETGSRETHPVDAIATAAVPSTGKSGLGRFLNRGSVARGGTKKGRRRGKPSVYSELDAARRRLRKSPTHYDAELKANANEYIKNAVPQGKMPAITDTNTPPKAQESSLNTLRNDSGARNPRIVIPRHHQVTLRRGINSALKRNAKRPEYGENSQAQQGSSRVPNRVMKFMKNALINSRGSRQTERRDRRVLTRLHKIYRFTKPNMHDVINTPIRSRRRTKKG